MLVLSRLIAVVMLAYWSADCAKSGSLVGFLVFAGLAIILLVLTVKGGK